MKTKRIILSITLFVIVLIAINACKKDVNPQYTSASNPTVIDPVIPVGNYPAGLGSTSGTPVCKPFILPNNVEIIGNIQSAQFKSTNFNKETQNVDDFIITPKTTFVELGSGSCVRFYLKLFNKNFQPT